MISLVGRNGKPRIWVLLQTGSSILQPPNRQFGNAPQSPTAEHSAGRLKNDAMFDKLIRKPYQQQRYNFQYPSNMKFAAIVSKHIALESALVICSTLGACAIFSVTGHISPSLLQSFNDPHFLLNRLFPFLLSISEESMRYTFQLMSLLSPGWIAGCVGTSWLGSKLELNKVYKKYEQMNEEMMLLEEKPTFVQQCSLEDGCNVVRFYGDESTTRNRSRFTKSSMKQSFYDGYGGDCSYKAGEMVGQGKK